MLMLYQQVQAILVQRDCFNLQMALDHAGNLWTPTVVCRKTIDHQASMLIIVPLHILTELLHFLECVQSGSGV